MENTTEVTHFILLGLTEATNLRVPLVMIFTLIYAINAIGNLGMILLILSDSRLHTPMYFFLSNLSLMDFCYSTAVIPTVMIGLFIGDEVISYGACATQMFFFVVFVSGENLILAAMAFDRFAAVCKPLHYTTIMTTGVCACLAIVCHAGGFLNACIHVGETFSLTFCSNNKIHHFFCDVPAVMSLSCSDKHVAEMVIVYVDTFNVFSALVVIFVSYVFIFIAIYRMRSSAGYQKALSTCASHVTAITIFYGTVIFMYLQPSSSHSMDKDKMASVFYTMVIPMLNPIVYSLRNKEVKNAINKLREKTKLSLGL
ncbi:olfactory receptor 5B3-like [Talpa occidentalis]|uniref:olfactory receptor 5B3-like n=1 Tax=Talpa occidentalis TaxID=50954 RepID=UPI00188F4F54|nr:olfactory receptor 5B3-like [Talpa occidentalis]XP_037377365.1 olfactory receptor 5B3-like [Talpa occidentalis]